MGPNPPVMLDFVIIILFLNLFYLGSLRGISLWPGLSADAHCTDLSLEHNGWQETLVSSQKISLSFDPSFFERSIINHGVS